MVYAGFEKIMEACSQIRFPALRLAVKLNMRYPLWFDEQFTQGVLRSGSASADQVSTFCEMWKKKGNFTVPLVIEVARKDELEEFVEVAENALVEIVKLGSCDAKKCAAVKRLFESYTSNLVKDKLFETLNAFMAKIANAEISFEPSDKFRKNMSAQCSQQRNQIIEKVIQENYYDLLQYVLFKGEVASRLVQFKVITMSEKQSIENSSDKPEGQARKLFLDYISKRPQHWNSFLEALSQSYSSKKIARLLKSSYTRLMDLAEYEGKISELK